MSVVEQDGAEVASACANESHAGHHGLNDSMWMQYQSVRRTYHAYLARPGGKLGYIIGMPGSWLEAGRSKVPGGCSEMAMSLPRWTWIHRVRERMIADPQYRDVTQPNAQRYFHFPSVLRTILPRL